MAKKKNRKILPLVMALIVVVLGSILFVGAASGWFDSHKVKLDAEYYADGAEFMELTAGEYEGLIEAKKSFVVMVDQSGCTTADRLREYVTRYMTETGILVYKMMFEQVKESSLHDQVKYYPSVVVVDKGVVRAYLRADSDEDAEVYNNYNAFREWMEKYLQ
ncbi:hypothetical protein IIY68_00455 [Candidatus Saccharibacteria bacterium]|nr:hypothetical protein [Candidatus Saccharibacteria bacterium]